MQSKEQKKAERRQFRRLSQKEKRVRCEWRVYWLLLTGPMPQRKQEKVRLERELKETQAVESKEKRTRMVPAIVTNGVLCCIAVELFVVYYGSKLSQSNSYSARTLESWRMHKTVSCCHQYWKALESMSSVVSIFIYWFVGETWGFVFRFAHLINVDFFADLTNILENVASSKVLCKPAVVYRLALYSLNSWCCQCV